MSSRLRTLATLFLRSTARGPLTEALPGEQEDRFARILRALWIDRLFRAAGRFVGLFLTAGAKARIQEFLINRFRIPVRWQPEERLQRHYEKALERLAESAGPAAVGDYLEFGVYQGNSMICMHRALTRLGFGATRIFGFDSFEGLPEEADREQVWSAGQFRSEIEFTRERLREAGVDLDRAHLIKGFFSDTLSPALARQHGIEKAGVIMVDSDLYSSAREALDFCAPLIGDEAVIFFDDWNSTDESGGEKRAFREFLEAHPDLTAEDFGTYLDNAQVFLVKRRPRTSSRPN